MAQSTIDGNLHVKGALTCTTFTPPAGSIGNAAIPAATIDGTKCIHRGRAVYAPQGIATTAASETRVMHVARADGEALSFVAGLLDDSVGDSTVTFDLKKNGVSILTGVVTLTSAHASYAVVAGVIATAAYVAGDVFTVTTVATAGTGTLGKGMFAMMSYDEEPA